MTDEEPIIEFKHVTFRYDGQEGHPAVQDVSISIYEGEYVALLGLNGAGKTTLQLCVNGVVPHSIMGDFEGQVLVNGLDVYDAEVRETAKTVGMVFDNPEFQMSQMTVAEEIALGLENLGVPPDEMHRRIPRVLDVVGLSGLEERSPFGLSGGQQQRLSIASALAMNPKILVMDEPTSNIDPIGKEEVFSVAAKLNKEQGMTVLIAEHEIEVMAAFADRVIVMDNGKVVVNGSPAEVFAQVDFLNNLGLRAPQVTEFGYKLGQTGRFDLKGQFPVVLSEAVSEFGAMLPGGGDSK